MKAVDNCLIEGKEMHYFVLLDVLKMMVTNRLSDGPGTETILTNTSKTF